MSATFTAKIHGSAPRKLKGLTDYIASEKKVFILGRRARSLIITRTLQGRDQFGAPFVPYSPREFRTPIEDRVPGYKKPVGGRTKPLNPDWYQKRYKRKSLKNMVFPNYATYKSALGFPTFVQLSISNSMLNDIQTRVHNPNVVELFFFGALSRAKAHGHTTGANDLPERDFFGIGNAKDIQDLNRELARYIQAGKKKVGL